MLKCIFPLNEDIQDKIGEVSAGYSVLTTQLTFLIKSKIKLTVTVGTFSHFAVYLFMGTTMYQ